MKIKTFYLIIFFFILICGLLLYLFYFHSNNFDDFLNVNFTKLNQNNSTSPVVPENERIPVPEASYTPLVTPSATPAITPEIIPPEATVPPSSNSKVLQNVGYRGIVINVNSLVLKFKPVTPENEKAISAKIQEDTKITSVILKNSGEERSVITLQDLKPNDEIMITGFALDYNKPIEQTLIIERFKVE